MAKTGDKLQDLSQAISRLAKPGYSVALGLGLEGFVPFAAVHEIIRQNIGQLTLIGGSRIPLTERDLLGVADGGGDGVHHGLVHLDRLHREHGQHHSSVRGQEGRIDLDQQPRTGEADQLAVSPKSEALNGMSSVSDHGSPAIREIDPAQIVERDGISERLGAGRRLAKTREHEEHP